MVMDAEQISALSDDELYAKLQEVGGAVGPIVASTRSVYERQLFRILNGIYLCESSQESGDEPERNKPVDDFVNSLESFTPSSTSSPQTVFGSKIEFRHRPVKSYAESHDGIYFDRTTLARSSYRSDLQNTSNENKFRHVSKQIPSTPSLQQSKKMPVGLLVVIAFVLIFVVLVYINMESSNINPIPAP